MVSFRGLDHTPVRTMAYEYEDLVAEVDDVDLVVPRHSWRSDVTYRATSKYLGRYRPAGRVDPGYVVGEPARRYDLLFTVLGFPREVLAFNALGDWRRRCDKAVVVVRELWVDELDDKRAFVERLNQWDHVVVEYADTVGPLQERLRVPVSFMPPSLDTELFCPLPDEPERCIYLSNIGRRSEDLHRRLQGALADRFYNYTTVAPDRVWDARDHRAAVASQLRRSRYSLVNRAKFDEQLQQEAGFRYFEGAAAGALLVGERVANAEFDRLFDWDDAVVEAGPDEVLDVLDELDRSPGRVEAARRRAVAAALERFDCAHRWRDVLGAVGMDALPALDERLGRLGALAEAARRGLAAA